MVEWVANKSANLPLKELLNSLSEKESAQYENYPSMRNLALGKAVHNTTAEILNKVFDDSVIYSRKGVDFTLDNGLEDRLVELTTPKGVPGHMIRYPGTPIAVWQRNVVESETIGYTP